MLWVSTIQVREVKKLDSDMQMLVYENYNKFISATDTIRKMAQNVEGMETEMTDLKSSMDRIADSSATVNASLESKQGGDEDTLRGGGGGGAEKGGMMRGSRRDRKSRLADGQVEAERRKQKEGEPERTATERSFSTHVHAPK